MVTVLNLFFTNILYIINVTRHYGVDGTARKGRVSD